MNHKSISLSLLLIIVLLSVATNATFGQQLAPKRKGKTILLPDSGHNIKLSIVRSAILPGWGQVYNHKWWKTPFIYTGLAFLGSSIISSNKQYHYYLSLALIGRKGISAETDLAQKDNPLYIDYKKLSAAGVTQTSLENAASNYQRNYQISILGFAGVWALQMLDAFIDAKMRHSYSIDDNLSFSLRPGLINTYAGLSSVSSLTPALKLTFPLQ